MTCREKANNLLIGKCLNYKEHVKTLNAHSFKPKTYELRNIFQCHDRTKVQHVCYHFNRAVFVLPHPGLAFKRGFQLFKSTDLNTSIKEDTFHTHCEK